MAIYHVSFNSVSRSSGHKASAAAAYRAGEKLQDEKYGMTHDYSNKKGVVSSGIFAPENSPDWVNDREKLWNEVEKSEKRVDAQLAREIEVALPRELEKQQQQELLNGYLKENFVQKGMVADWAIHESKSRDGKTNPHAHVLLTMRPIEADGFSAKKDRSWNDPKLGLEWRESWADHANRALEKAGVKDRIDHRSLVDQKEEAVKNGDEKKANELDRNPTVKEGRAATALRHKGEFSERVDLNDQIRKDNERVAALRGQIAQLKGSLEKNKEFASKEKVNLDQIRVKASDNYNKASSYRDAAIHKYGSKIGAWENRGLKQRINDWIRGNSPVGMIKDWAMDKGLIKWDSYHTRRTNYERAKEAINKAEDRFKDSKDRVEQVYFDKEYKDKIEKLNRSIDQAKERQSQQQEKLQAREEQLKQKLSQLKENQEKLKSGQEKETPSHQQSDALKKMYEQRQKQQGDGREGSGKQEPGKAEQGKDATNRQQEDTKEGSGKQEPGKAEQGKDATNRQQEDGQEGSGKQEPGKAEQGKDATNRQQEDTKEGSGKQEQGKAEQGKDAANRQQEDTKEGSGKQEQGKAEQGKDATNRQQGDGQEGSGKQEQKKAEQDNDHPQQSEALKKMYEKQEQQQQERQQQEKQQQEQQHQENQQQQTQQPQQNQGMER